MLRGIAVSFIVLALTISCDRGTRSSHRAVVTPPAGRPADGAACILFTDASDRRVAESVATLEAAGCTTARSEDEVVTLIGPATHSLVLTRTAWQHTSPSLLRSLYERGVVIAALDVSMAELGEALPVGGDGWLPYLPERAIFSLAWRCRDGTGATSDVLDGRDLPRLLRSRQQPNASSNGSGPDAC